MDGECDECCVDDEVTGEADEADTDEADESESPGP